MIHLYQMYLSLDYFITTSHLFYFSLLATDPKIGTFERR